MEEIVSPLLRGDTADHHILHVLLVQYAEKLFRLKAWHGRMLSERPCLVGALFEGDHVYQVVEALLRGPGEAFDNLGTVRVFA